MAFWSYLGSFVNVFGVLFQSLICSEKMRGMERAGLGRAGAREYGTTGLGGNNGALWPH